MFIQKDTLDDVLADLYPWILDKGVKVKTSREKTIECVGVLLEIALPRARLSWTETRGKPFSCLGELCWYLSGENSLDFIKYYIPRYEEESKDKETIYGAYGPRLLDYDGVNQIQNVINLLVERPTSRRAVIQLFSAADIETHHVEIPCTTTFQFILRDGKLDMITTMRSNDAYMGLPHDIFCFTMLQEIIARSLSVDIGIYRHFVASMHLYEANIKDVKNYLGEGVQSRFQMPPMPEGDPWTAISALLAAEDDIRQGLPVDAKAVCPEPYWADLVRLLQLFAASGSSSKLNSIQGELSFDKYAAYIHQRRNKKPPKKPEPIQARFNFKG